MTIEATLTRKLSISFIGARALATEAKLQMGIQGYPSKDMQERVTDLAVELFHGKTEDIQRGMLRERAIVDMAKEISISRHSLSSSSRHSLSSSRHSMDSGPAAYDGTRGLPTVSEI